MCATVALHAEGRIEVESPDKLSVSSFAHACIMRTAFGLCHYMPNPSDCSESTYGSLAIIRWICSSVFVTLRMLLAPVVFVTLLIFMPPLSVVAPAIAPARGGRFR